MGETKIQFPNFFDWVEKKNVDLQPWQWELVRVLSDGHNVRPQVARRGKTLLHSLWWNYHAERAQVIEGKQRVEN